ncbi:hypothetical protein DRJ17_00270 [Candidatus Woesearchaeota archaeon]|nr:MAG: hypothetical protein DRJ17_00270 [Candidatus Woesearchaeota archaeon]
MSCQKQPKILVGCPTYIGKQYCWQHYVGAVKALTYNNKDVLIVDNSKTDEYYHKIKKDLPTIKDEFLQNAKDRIVHSRNLLREKVLNEEYDYFLSLEQDVIPPKNIIEALLNHGKKIVTAVYLHYQKTTNGKLAPAVLAYKKVGLNDAGENIVQPYSPQEIIGKGLVLVSSCGMGCLLIHRDVLENVRFRHVPGKKSFDDIWFCIDAKKAGYNIYCDGNCVCGHVVQRPKQRNSSL